MLDLDAALADLDVEPVESSLGFFSISAGESVGLEEMVGASVTSAVLLLLEEWLLDDLFLLDLLL